jgi:hypothetical protein
MPDKPVDTVNPYHATDVRTDRVGAMTVIRFPTNDGLPLLVAMDENLSAKLLRELERVLAAPSKRSR